MHRNGWKHLPISNILIFFLILRLERWNDIFCRKKYKEKKNKKKTNDFHSNSLFVTYFEIIIRITKKPNNSMVATLLVILFRCLKRISVMLPGQAQSVYEPIFNSSYVLFLFDEPHYLRLPSSRCCRVQLWNCPLDHAFLICAQDLCSVLANFLRDSGNNWCCLAGHRQN